MLPSGTEDPGFRRMAAPQGQVLRRAARLAGGAPITSPTVINTLARGELQPNLSTAALDGLVTSQLLEALPRPAAARSAARLSACRDGRPWSWSKRSPALLQLEQLPPGSIVLRPNIGLSGVVTEHQVEQVRAAVGVAGSVHGALQALVEHALQPAAEEPPPVAGWTRPSPCRPRPRPWRTRSRRSFRSLTWSASGRRVAVELAGLQAGVVAALDPFP